MILKVSITFSSLGRSVAKVCSTTLVSVTEADEQQASLHNEVQKLMPHREPMCTQTHPGRGLHKECKHLATVESDGRQVVQVLQTVSLMLQRQKMA